MNEEPFEFDIQEVFLLPAGSTAGLYLAGSITAGIVRVGDALQVRDADRVIGQVTVEAVEFLDRALSGPNPQTLVALRVSGVEATEVAAGHHLRSTQSRVA